MPKSTCWVCPKIPILNHYSSCVFLFVFLYAQGRVSGNLSNVPIYAVMVENLGERGAQYTALKLLQEVQRSGGGSGGSGSGASKTTLTVLLICAAAVGVSMLLKRQSSK